MSMHQLYNMHTPFVAVFLVFVVAFVAANIRERRR